MYKDFTDMPMWQTALEIGESVFLLTNDLPKKEDYGLASQIRRAFVSISANIAEAFGRTTALDKNKFYDYSRGSAFETKSLLLYGIKVGYFTNGAITPINEKIDEVIYNLNKVKMALTNKSKSQSQFQTYPKPQPKSQPQP